MYVARRPILSAMLCILAIHPDLSWAAEVLSFHPIGSVKNIQQVVVRFSADMVAMGDSRSKADPFSVSCGEEQDIPSYDTHWADNRSWVLDFEKPLRAGVRCTFKLNEGLKDLEGRKVQALEEYGFSTSGPALLAIAPYYDQIQPDQYFVALSDGPMDKASVESVAYFEVDAIPDKVRVRIVEGKDREAVIRAAIKNDWRWRSYAGLLEPRGSEPARGFSEIREFDSFIVLAGSRRFPENSKVVLHWPQGILSKSGLAVEEPQSYTFNVIAPFEAKFMCERTSPERACNPVLNLQVGFSGQVSLEDLKGAKLVSSDGKTWVPKELTEGKESQVQSLTFDPPFPESTAFKLILPADLKDELGRPLTNQAKFPLDVSTDEYSPLIKFAAPFGIVELEGGAALPVSLRNVEKQLPARQVSIEGKALRLSSQANALEVISWYRKVSSKEYNTDLRNTSLLGKEIGISFEIQKPQSEKEFELIGIPLNKPGFHVIEMSSPRLGQALTGAAPMFVAASALVTDLGVHFKKGRESSLVWVTRLSSAKPVKGASIAIFDGLGKELSKGITDADGILRLGKIDDPCSRDDDEQVRDYDACELFVFASKDEDFSFSSSRWDKGIEAYRYSIPMEYLSSKWGPVVAHTVLDRMVAQRGETIQMKHFLREHQGAGFGALREKRLPKRVLVVHEGSRKTYTLPFEWEKGTGTALNKFEIPKDGALGRYEIYLSNEKEASESSPSNDDEEEGDSFDWNARASGHFVVSEYRLPLMKASVKIQGESLVRPEDVKVDLSAAYLSGGPAKRLKVRLRASLQPGTFSPDVPGGDGYRFFSIPLKPGVEDSVVRQSAEESFMSVQDLELKEDGGLAATVRNLPLITNVQQLALEMEYTDPNGEVRSTNARVPLYPAHSIVGLRSESWITEPGKTKVEGVIVDTAGKPQPNRVYRVEAFRTNYLTHRKRLVGGFYSYDSKLEVIALGKVCDGKSDEFGRFRCEPKGLPAGNIVLQAQTEDERGRSTFAAVEVSVMAEGSSNWWVPGDSDRIDVLPEKGRYEPHEKARLAVRSPFPRSILLVTVEREGILDAVVTEIKRDNPVIEVPLKGNYAPNVFVSVMALRGRTGDPKPTALVDLAKPSMKMGITELKVGWASHELQVEVKSDKARYRTREKAKVSIRVKPTLGGVLPKEAEVAVVAIDEALLRLKENTSWKLLEALMGQRGLAVSTSSGQNQIVGRRHFGAKAKPPGGGGGTAGADPRELFEPVLLWLPRVKLDASGEAKVEVPLNDSITSFRVVAVAAAGADLFGNGQVTIESSKDLIIYSGFAPLARDGDAVESTITLRNTTARPMKVSLDLKSEEIQNLLPLPPIELNPSEAKVVSLALTIPSGVAEVSYQLHAKDMLSGTEDSMAGKMRILDAVPSRVTQATLFQLEKSRQIPVMQPGSAIPGKGGLNVQARPSLVSGLARVKSYMDDYPYSCLEQRISRAVVLEDKAEVKRIMDALPSYMDEDGLLKFFASSRCGSVPLTRYVLSVSEANAYGIPAATKKRLITGLVFYLQGKASCTSWWDDYLPDHYSDEAKILVMETLSRHKAFQPGVLSMVKLAPNLWKTQTLVAWFQLLKRHPEIPGQAAHLKQAENILRARVHFQGSLMNVQGELDWEAQWRLFSSRDEEAISVLALTLDEKSWEQDLGRMARGVIARLREGRWDTTMANAWGMTVLRRFSERVEKEKPTGETRISAGGVLATVNWQSSPKGEKKILNWPKGSEKQSVAVQIDHTGSGKPWIHFETLASIPLKDGVDRGYRVSKKITPIVQAKEGTWSVGDVANIELTVNAKSDQSWVVVRDPVPAGASHLGTGLDGASSLLDQDPVVNAGSQETQDWPTEYNEKSHSDFISYAAYLPRGAYRVSYRIRLNSAGKFRLPPTRVEAMYAPETFGESPNGDWNVSR